MAGQHYCLRWNNYQTNMTSVFHQLLQNEAFVDVTLACNDLSLKAHKVVLSACSSYFQKLLLANPCKHPTIIMPQDVCYADLKFIIEFVYKGEIDVSQAELQSLLRTADQLKIKGLCETTNGEEEPLYETFPISNKDVTKVRRPLSPKLSSPRPVNTEFNNNINKRKNKYRRPVRLIDDKQQQQQNNEQNGKDVVPQETDSNLAFKKIVIEASSEEEDDMPIALSNHSTSREERLKKRKRLIEKDKELVVDADVEDSVDESMNDPKPLNMSSNGMLASQTLFSQFGVDNDDFPPQPLAPTATPVGHLEMDHSPTRTLLNNTNVHRTDLSDVKLLDIKKEVDIKFETLRSYDQDSLLELDSSHLSGPDHSMDSHEDPESSNMPMMITPELMGLLATGSNRFDQLKTNGHHDQNTGDGIVTRSHTSSGQPITTSPGTGGAGPKTWTQDDMDLALDALRNHNMSLTKASATYGIPSTTLWQRAHRLGIDTPKKEGPTKSWTEESLNSALEALRTGTISANKASKAYGIPSSTLYKIARREGIRLAAPFNAAPTTWSPEDLEKALESIRSGQTSVQRASTEFGIPTGTLYGRCKREGIELSRSNPTPWSEDAMGEALEAVRLGHMSINQAAIHYNLPYSSLYGRFKRGVKYDTENIDSNSDSQSHLDMDSHSMLMEYSQQQQQHQQITYHNSSNS